MRRDVALLVALTLAGATAISTGATPLATDGVTDDIHLSPASDYAYLDADGELTIDVSASNPALDADGVNDDGLTNLGDVFRVRYDGEERARVWFTADSDAVTFLADGRPVQSKTNAVVLGSNESETVGLAIDAREFDGRIDAFEVHATVTDSERVGATQAESSDTEGDGGDPSIRIGRPAADRRLVMASDVSTSETVAVQFDGLVVNETDGRTLTLEELRVRRTGTGNLGFDVEAGVPADADIDEARVLGAVRVTPTVGGDTVDSAVFRFGVAGVNASTERLTVYRYSGNESSRLAVEKLDDGRAVSAESTGFSTFVVAVERTGRATETTTRVDEERDADAETSVDSSDPVPADDSAADIERSAVDSHGVNRESAGAGSPSTTALGAIFDAISVGRLATAPELVSVWWCSDGGVSVVAEASNHFYRIDTSTR
ncbi:DUF1102 domain-containing protein [Haloplanus sp. C73]|uniref:DUF1102 domain-containing protein n=1 Tax=Haloplanus sp. C73 TaxID=3421641 RepID=UPI003EBC8864